MENVNAPAKTSKTSSSGAKTGSEVTGDGTGEVTSGKEKSNLPIGRFGEARVSKDRPITSFFPSADTTGMNI